MPKTGITLYAFKAPAGSINLSPFCAKAELLLRLAELPFEIDTTGNHGSFSKGKLPVIKDGDKIVEDTEFIRAHIFKEYGKNLDGTLKDSDKAAGHAIVRMLEGHTLYGMITGRWLDEAGWEKTEKVFFGGLPDDTRHEIASAIRTQNQEYMMKVGFGRHSRAEQIHLLQADIAAAAQALGDMPWLFSEHPTYLDAAVFSQLANYRAKALPIFLADIVAEHDNLVAYIRRGLDHWYPETAHNN